MSLAERFPYPSRRVASFGEACVATSQPLAAEAGLAVLAAGGNAVDAVLATAITLTVVEPTMNGLGGDLFALVHDGKQLHGLNSSGRSARSWNPGRLSGTMPLTGWDTVTVPGQVRGWEVLHARFGRTSWADLFGRAIRYARDGFLVPHVVARHWALQASWFCDIPGFTEAFLPGGNAPEAGQRFRHHGLEASLNLIAGQGADAFYLGPLAERIDAFARETGGALRATDLAEHRAEWVEPLAVEFAGTRIHELPPNGQGLTALIALGLIERRRADFEANETERLHLEIEATRRARDLVARHVGDTDHMTIAASALLDDAFLDRLAGEIGPDRANLPPGWAREGWGTVYACAADRDGMMVSLIQSNYRGFGSGLVVPGTGISLHNRGACFVLEPGHPNAAAPGKRPFNTIIPGFMTRGGKPFAAFGIMGGGMQPQAHVQFATRLLARGENVQAAIDAPRWRIAEDGALLVEETLPAAIAGLLRAKGHDLRSTSSWDYQFGAAQAIIRQEDGYEAGTESRRDGVVAVL